MSAIIIEGGRRLNGELEIQGSKNAVLPIMAASLLIQGVTVIYGCPVIDDVLCMKKLLEELGCEVTFEKHKMTICAEHIDSVELKETSVKKVRASVLFLGSLLGRKREARVNYPGGCSIGKRPIDYHLEAFRKMGVKVTEEDEQVSCKARRIKGQKIALEFPSVGATENIILAACLADGVTWITGAAREPEIVELCQFLRLAGAVIEGEGTDHIFIRGVKKLRNTEFTVCHDRIVLSTLGLLVAGTGGNVLLKTGEKKVPGDIQILSRTGCICKAMEGRVLIRQNRKPKAIYYIKTRPYPGFPTDVQSPLMAVMTKAEGDTIIDESIFENRMQTADELNKLGADITVVGNRAFIRGVKSLEGTSVRATDLRGGMALVIAGLMAEGKTKIENEEVILRGYENLPESLSGIGAKIYYE